MPDVTSCSHDLLASHQLGHASTCLEAISGVHSSCSTCILLLHLSRTNLRITSQSQDLWRKEIRNHHENSTFTLYENCGRATSPERDFRYKSSSLWCNLASYDIFIGIERSYWRCSLSPDNSKQRWNQRRLVVLHRFRWARRTKYLATSFKDSHQRSGSTAFTACRGFGLTLDEILLWQPFWTLVEKFD